MGGTDFWGNLGLALIDGAILNKSDFDIEHQVMSMCSVFSCVVGRQCLLRPVHSLGNTLIAFDLLCFVLQGQIYLLLLIH